MNKEKINEMIKELEYSVEYHTTKLQEKAIQLKALQQMKEGKK
jgi:hypothetical protein